MDDDQQFCLRWNNHQSTLVAVFDTLLENGTLVDCTLAAEGQFLRAHKVVLSACSPYFEALLSRHYDKHPILILKDVKFQELKAMMDYMYRGEVNISQDQLGALLKAAESLQIKGLSDNKKDEAPKKHVPQAASAPKSPPAQPVPKVQGLTIERSRDDSREGSMSPGPRKKKRMRRKSEDDHEASNSSESHSLPSTNIPAAAQKMLSHDSADQVETKQEILTRHKEESQPAHAHSNQTGQTPMVKEKLETHSELMLEPKSEYVEEMNEDSIEDLTLDDDDLSNMDQMDDGSTAGPSHAGEGSSAQQGFGTWHMGNQSQDEVFLAAQEAVGAHRDSQDNESNLPAKSRAQYERTYNVFIDWQNKNELSEPFSQKTFLQYFQNLQERMKPSSLWSVYSMLRMTINLKHNYDISQHKELLQYLKQISRGYKPKKAKIFTPEQIKDFLTLAPDNEYLFIKVGLIFGVMGACKSHELVRIDISDVEDLNSALLVHIYNTDNNTERQFVISGYYYNICKKYMDLRPDNIGNMTRFFINYQNGRCVKQPIGIHKFGALPMQVAKFLGLPEHASYTAHSFRRSSACLPL